MSVQAMEWALGAPLEPRPKLVLVGLANHADAEGRRAYPTLARLAEYASCSRDTARRCLRALQEGGWIRRVGFGPKGQWEWALELARGSHGPAGGMAKPCNPPEVCTAMPSEPSVTTVQIPPPTPLQVQTGGGGVEKGNGNGNGGPAPPAPRTAPWVREAPCDDCGAAPGAYCEVYGDVRRRGENHRARWGAREARVCPDCGGDGCVADHEFDALMGDGASGGRR